MIKIIVDSTAYIPEEYIIKNDITVVPLRVLCGDKDIEEGTDAAQKEIFEFMEKNPNEIPKTSQPSLEVFQNHYKRIIDDGNEVLVITLGSNLSGTNSVANLAKRQVNSDKITVFDSENSNQVVWQYVQEVFRLEKEGKSLNQILEYLETLKANSQILFIPESMNNLKKSGRVNTLTALVGTILNIKPIISFKENVVSCHKKCFGMLKAIQDLVASIPKTVQKIYVMKVYKSKFFDLLKSKVQDAFPNAKKIECELGPVFATHVGLGAIGACWVDGCKAN